MKGLKATIMLALMGGTPALADVWEYGQDECNQLWFMRNLIMDRTGYCFGSTLGKSLFDNSDCTGKEVRLETEQSRQVQKIQALEAEIGCKVDTGQSSLDVWGMSELRRLRDMPLPDNGATGCIGWKGPAVPLYDGYSAGSRMIGQIEPGDNVDNGFIPEGNWQVVIVAKGGDRDRLFYGWQNSTEIDWRTSCTSMAG